MSERPLLLLDIDGVLCPIADTAPASARRHQLPAPYSWVWVLDKQRERLKRLAEAYQIMWCTAWEHRANEIHGPQHGLQDLDHVVLGAEHLDGAIYVPGARDGHGWKHPAVSAFIAAQDPDRPIAWIDDSLTAADIEYFRQRPHTLLVVCDPEIGMTDDDVERLLAFALAQ